MLHAVRFLLLMWRNISRHFVRSPSQWIASGRVDRIILRRPHSDVEIRVRAASRAAIKLSARFLGDLSGDRNFILILGGGALDETSVANMGYVKSRIGYYKYLSEFVRDGRLLVDFEIDERVESIKFQIWNFDGPVVLEDFQIESDVAKFNSERLVASREAVTQAIDVRPGNYPAVNFLLRRHKCGAHCISHCEKWLRSMDAVAQRHKKANFGRRDIYISSEFGELIPANLQNSAPAFLVIPQTTDDYLFEIGDKSRNMLRKAKRMGYVFSEVAPEGYEADIVAIRTSDPMRQGRPIPEYYYSNPPQYVLSPSPVGCQYHTEKFFGVFLDGRLVSYITVLIFGEFAQINQILCHKDHVKNGVMNLNVFNVVDGVISNYPWVRAINYLYIGSGRAGIDVFKGSVGFRAIDVAVYDSVLCGGGAFPRKNRERVDVNVEARGNSSRHKRKLEKRDFVFEKVLPEAAASRIEAMLGGACVNLAPPKLDEFIRFFSKEIGELAERHPVGTYFAVPFPCSVTQEESPEIAGYLMKRFKGNPVPKEGFETAFKGGRLRALAFFALECGGGNPRDGILILEKLV
ncbi:hypothetical protein [Burkholderia sp. A9]|uniref:hypothetical protein n=1 Tax=Burkholderia sp. A9 TaxID=1365108 RepID=UPI000A8FB6E5|nr:hypothetical protein [Burkholderia sp. A9]